MSRSTGPREDASLTSILPNQALRTELALLVALSTDTMRRELLTLFEPSNTQANISTTEESLINLQTISSGQSAAAVERRRLQRDLDLSSPRMQGLRRAALAFFDTWQIKVLRRVGEVVGVRSGDVRQARRGHNESFAEREKRKADERYWNWANGMDEEEPKAKEEESVEQRRLVVVPTKLVELEESDRLLVLHSLLLVLLSLESYTAHSRVLLLHISSSLRIPVSVLNDHESTIAKGLLESAKDMSTDEHTNRRGAADASKRRWKVGLATVAGAALIGVTGGLAAPLLAAGVGTVMGGIGLGATAMSGLLGTLAGSSVLIGGLFGAYGGKMTGGMVDRYAREVKDFRFIPISSTDGSHKLRVAIGVSGWLTEELDIVQPWMVWDRSIIETFPLRWEQDALMDLGASLTSLLQSFAWSCAKWELVRRTLLGSLYAGLWPLGLLKMGSVVDNPFSIARARADKAGRVLADALMSKVQGERPVTLVGFSLGARLIYSCLLALSERHAFGLVENVVLMGAPVPSLAKDWIRVRAVVSGRVVNAFSTDDFILGFLYRTSSIQFGIAGVQPVNGIHGVDNIDMTKSVKGHTKWKNVVGQVLQRCEVGDTDDEMVESEIQNMMAMDETEEKRIRSTEEKLQMEGKATIIQEESRTFVQASHQNSHEQKEPRRMDVQRKPLPAHPEKPAVAAERPIQESSRMQEEHGTDPGSDAESVRHQIQMIDLDPEPDELEVGRRNDPIRNS